MAVHRRHHAFTDVEGDPHSPLLDGFLAVQLGNPVLYRRAARDSMTVSRYARDLPPDRLDRAGLEDAARGDDGGGAELLGCHGESGVSALDRPGAS